MRRQNRQTYSNCILPEVAKAKTGKKVCEKVNWQHRGKKGREGEGNIAKIDPNKL